LVRRADRPILAASDDDEYRCNRSQPSRGSVITYTSALLAVVAGIVHAGLAPVIVVGGVKPNLLLVAVVLVTVSFGFRAGLLWAFVGGLVANLLVPQPLGSIPLTLLLAVALVAGGQQLFGRLVWVYPVVAAFAASVVHDALLISLLELIGEPLRVGVPFDLMLPAAVLNAALTGVALYPVRALSQRLVADEGAW
jgi:rod shape-determining protein MreD